MSWGTIESMTDKTIVITKDSFAPGIWAGVKPDKFTIVRDYKIVDTIYVKGANLNTRELEYSQVFDSRFKVGDQIYFYPRIANGI